MTGRQRAAGQDEAAQQAAWPKPGEGALLPWGMGEADARAQLNTEAKARGRRVEVMRAGAGPARVAAQLTYGRQQGRGAGLRQHLRGCKPSVDIKEKGGRGRKALRPKRRAGGSWFWPRARLRGRGAPGGEGVAGPGPNDVWEGFAPLRRAKPASGRWHTRMAQGSAQARSVERDSGNGGVARQGLSDAMEAAAPLRRPKPG